MKDFNRLLKSLVFQKLVLTTFQRGFEVFFNSNILQNPKGNLHSCKNLQYTWLKKIHISNCDCSEKHSERDLPNITNHKNGKDVFYFLFTEEVFPMLSPILSCPKLTKSRMLYNYHIEYEFV